MKARCCWFILLTIFSIYTVQAQDSTNTSKDTLIYSPYKFKYYVDVPIVVVGFGTNYLGLKGLRAKKAADTSVLLSKPGDVKFLLDRSATKQNPSYAKTANLLSDVSLISCFVMPGFLYFDNRVRKDVFKILLMHMEVQAIMANMYFLTMNIAWRNRPYTYNIDEDRDRRIRRGNNNSFYGGHASHAASCSFFIAKVLSDYYPERIKWRPYLYTAALIPPGIVGYFRYKGGQHFPSDLIIGTAIGAGVGMLIPELHKPRKKKNRKKLSVEPTFFPANGFSVTYKL